MNAIECPLVQRAALEDALRQLHVLDALDVDGRVTPTGKAMAALPLEPSLARALLAAREFGCLEEMLSVAGLLSVEGSVFLGGSGPEQLLQEGSKEGEGLTLPAAWAPVIAPPLSLAASILARAPCIRPLLHMKPAKL